MKKFNTKKLVIIAMMVGLNIILTRLMSFRIAIGPVEGIRIGFGAFPIIFSGIFLDPLSGLIVGALGDFFGYFINPIGPYMPHFTLTAALTGFIPGFIMKFLFRNKKDFISFFISVLIGQALTSVLLVPFFIKILFGVPLKALIIPRIFGETVNIFIYSYIFHILNKRNIVNFIKK